MEAKRCVGMCDVWGSKQEDLAGLVAKNIDCKRRCESGSRWTEKAREIN